MFAALLQVGILGIVVVTVINFVVGGVYFGALMAKSYAVAMGRPHEPRAKPTGLMIVGPALCGLLITLTNGVLIQMLNLQTMGEAIAFGGHRRCRISPADDDDHRHQSQFSTPVLLHGNQCALFSNFQCARKRNSVCPEMTSILQGM